MRRALTRPTIYAQAGQAQRRFLTEQQKLQSSASQNGSDSEWEGAENVKASASDEKPPGIFATVGLMGFGAVGAVGVAVLGVMAVFQMANTVAAGTGRSMMADSKSDISQTENRDAHK